MPLPGRTKSGQNQVVDGERRFAHQVADQGVMAQPAWADSGKGAGSRFIERHMQFIVSRSASAACGLAVQQPLTLSRKRQNTAW